MNNEGLTAVIVRWRYDWVAYRLDKQGRRLSREGKILLEDDELCRPWVICKVEKVWEYDYKILSSKVDK